MTKKKQKRQQNDIRYVCAYYNYVHFSVVPILSNCILSVFHLYLKRLNNVRPVHKVKLVQKSKIFCIALMAEWLALWPHSAIIVGSIDREFKHRRE